MKNRAPHYLIICLITFFILPIFTSAQEVYDDYQGTWNVKIEKVLSEENKPIGWGETESLHRTIEVKFLNGPKKGQTAVFETDFPNIDIGDRLFVNHLVDIAGVERYSITNIDRRFQIYALIGLFIFAVIAFGGKQGIRSLLSLAGSFLAIFYILIPGILYGWHPLISSFLVATGILFAAIFFTHGFNKESAVAYFGTMISVVLTSIIAIISVAATKLSGFSGDESIYLNINTGGNLDFTGILLGAIIIGILGVLDDIAVTQAAVVSELYDSNKNISKKEVFMRAMRIGKEHVSALVNTLVLAYTGTALPLLMLFKVYDYDFNTVINMEIFASEIIRTIVGSIGLIMTVPIVTALAVVFLKGYKSKGHHCHSHGHK